MSSTAPFQLSLADILKARHRIRDFIHVTPVLESNVLNERSKTSLYFKCDNFQKTGAFKVRGATNAILLLSNADACRGVVTHSSGNHGAALAYAAKIRGISAHIVVPEDAPAVKIEAIKRYGGIAELCEPTNAARHATAEKIQRTKGAVLIHSSDNQDVIAGQGTLALELIDAVVGLDAVFCPIGGGGLISALAIVAKGVSPGTRVIGVEPIGVADAYNSLKSGILDQSASGETIADGLRATLNEKTFKVVREFVDDIVTVSDSQIASAMRTLFQVLKIVVEPSAAVAYSAIMDGIKGYEGKRVGIVVTGGNLALDKAHAYLTCPRF